MRVFVKLNPMPAVRMTQKSMYYGRAAEYEAYKNDLAQELRLNLVGTVKGGKVEMTDKPDRNLLPFKGTAKLEVKFFRELQTNCDIDNLLKTVMDTLQTAGILYNDDQVREIKAVMYKGFPKGSGSFEFILTHLQDELHLPKRQLAQIPAGTAG